MENREIKDEEIVAVEQFETNSPFKITKIVIGENEDWKIALGGKIIAEGYESKEQAEIAIDIKDWKVLWGMVCRINEIMNKSK